jgi:hypothetical protein
MRRRVARRRLAPARRAVQQRELVKPLQQRVCEGVAQRQARGGGGGAARPGEAPRKSVVLARRRGASAFARSRLQHRRRKAARMAWARTCCCACRSVTRCALRPTRLRSSTPPAHRIAAACAQRRMWHTPLQRVRRTVAAAASEPSQSSTFRRALSSSAAAVIAAAGAHAPRLATVRA